jgi:hypothetical protein
MHNFEAVFTGDIYRKINMYCNSADLVLQPYIYLCHMHELCSLPYRDAYSLCKYLINSSAVYCCFSVVVRIFISPEDHQKVG